MKPLWDQLISKFESLSERERVSVLVAVVLASVYVVFALAIEPPQRRADGLRKHIAEQTTLLQTLQTQTGATAKADPDALNRARTEELKGSLESLDGTLRSMQRDLVSADRMSSLLQEVLAREPGLELVAMRTLPPSPLIEKPKAAEGGISTSQADPGSANQANAYKHGIELTVRGSYANLHAYLVRLENSPWRMFWWRAKLSASDDPQVLMVITIYTISLDKAWLQV
jgi:MSHA biogenesis protein MshJ